MDLLYIHVFQIVGREVILEELKYGEILEPFVVQFIHKKQR